MTDEERTIFGTSSVPRVDERAYVAEVQRSMGVPGPGDPPLADPWAALAKRNGLNPRGIVTSTLPSWADHLFAQSAGALPPPSMYAQLRLDSSAFQAAIRRASALVGASYSGTVRAAVWDEEHRMRDDALQLSAVFDNAMDLVRRNTIEADRANARDLTRFSRAVSARGTTGHRHAGTRAWAHRYCSHRRGRCTERRVKRPLRFWSATTAIDPTSGGWTRLP